MSRLVRTSDDSFKHELSTYLRDTREALRLIEDVVSRVDVFKRDDFMFELRKVREYADQGAAFAVRDAVARVLKV